MKLACKLRYPCVLHHARCLDDCVFGGGFRCFARHLFIGVTLDLCFWLQSCVDFHLDIPVHSPGSLCWAAFEGNVPQHIINTMIAERKCFVQSACVYMSLDDLREPMQDCWCEHFVCGVLSCDPHW